MVRPKGTHYYSFSWLYKGNAGVNSLHDRRGSIPRASGARARVVRLLYMIPGHNSMMLRRPDPLPFLRGCGYARLRMYVSVTIRNVVN